MFAILSACKFIFFPKPIGFPKTFPLVSPKYVAPELGCRFSGGMGAGVVSMLAVFGTAPQPGRGHSWGRPIGLAEFRLYLILGAGSTRPFVVVNPNLWQGFWKEGKTLEASSYISQGSGTCGSVQ